MRTYPGAGVGVRREVSAKGEAGEENVRALWDAIGVSVVSG